jgi:hypothetical protein
MSVTKIFSGGVSKSDELFSSSWKDIGENGTKGAKNLMYWDITPPVLSTGNRTSLKPQLLCMLQLRKIVNTQD